MAGFATRLWRLEKYPPPVLPFTRRAQGRDKGVWEALLEQLVTEPDYEWLMIDASHIKVHPHAAGAKGGNQDMAVTKGGSTVRNRLKSGMEAIDLRKFWI